MATKTRQEQIKVLTSAGWPTDGRIQSLHLLNDKQMNTLVDAVEEHTHDGQHWLQAHGKALRHITVDDLGTVLFYLDCSNCGMAAVFTAEGPNDEYPDPLCADCEEGEEAHSE